MSPSIGSGCPLLTAWRRIPGPPRDLAKARLLRLYVALERRFGPQHWRLGRTSFEIAVGAILAQFTTWRNAARAVNQLRSRGLASPARLAAAAESDVADAVRAVGRDRLTGRRVRALTRWLLERFGGRVHGMRRAPLPALRRDLLGVTGMGPEAADAILLYAAGRPVFVADGYARRVLSRHRLVPRAAPYEATRAFIEAHLPSDPALFGEYHALLVAVGTAYCRAIPRCHRCPLRFDLGGRGPEGARLMLSRSRGRRGPGRPGARRRSGSPGRAPGRSSP